MRETSLKQKIRYGAEALAFFAFMGFFRLLGVDAASALGGAIGRNIFSRSRLTNRARENLSAAFPEKSQAEIEVILRAMWDNLGRTVAEYAHLDKFDIQGPGARITIAGGEHVRRIQDHAMILVSGHFANWEILPIAAARFGLDGAVVYRPPNNPHVARWVSRARAVRGYHEQISKHHGAKRIFTLLRGGKAILLLADQKTNEGVAAPFFGRDAMTTPAPAALALKLDTPILFASNRRLGGARFAVTVHPPLAFTPSGDSARDVQAMTAAINIRLEEMVRDDPSQWLWIHRRWPTSKDAPTGRRNFPV